jgi:hypothetical protein
LKQWSGATGPKVSSLVMTMSVVTSVSTVGSKKVPPCAARLPPMTTLAPFLTASAMCASTFPTASMSGRDASNRAADHALCDHNLRFVYIAHSAEALTA